MKAADAQNQVNFLGRGCPPESKLVLREVNAPPLVYR